MAPTLLLRSGLWLCDVNFSFTVFFFRIIELTSFILQDLLQPVKRKQAESVHIQLSTFFLVTFILI